MMEDGRMVLVLDDEPSVLRGLERLLTGHGYQVRLHLTPESLFADGLPKMPACLLLDNNLNHGQSGLQVHAEVLRRGWHLPTIFLTGHWNVKEVVNAIRAGADGFLTKPYDPDELLANVADAIERARNHHQQQQAVAEARLRSSSLTKREREVVCHVVSGKLNKEIAVAMGLALITVKVHRGRAMRKLNAGNAAELARIASLAGLCP